MPQGGADWREIDWRAPWLTPYAGVAAPVLQRLAQGDSVAAALGSTGSVVRFVPQCELPEGEAYETYIRRSGCVPTRDNLHDLFNGLVWLRFPALKQRLNALHAEQIAAEGIAPARGPLRDALTLFDENGAWWQASAALVQALQRRDWHALFVGHRTLWAQARLTLVGHALLEKLVAPRKAITAHLWLAAEGAGQVDTLTAATWIDKPFLPLPVLGVPGWWPANELPGFYDDADVFRAARG